MLKFTNLRWYVVIIVLHMRIKNASSGLKLKGGQTLPALVLYSLPEGGDLDEKTHR